MFRKQMIAVALLVLAVPALAAVSYSAHMTGDQAVPPTMSTASGDVVFRPDKKDAKVGFKVTVENLFDVMEVHLYMGNPGEPALPELIVATLYPGPLIPGMAKRVLCTGALGADVLIGPLAGHGFDELIRTMENDRLLVNVVTLPYLEGEIRGQVH